MKDTGYWKNEKGSTAKRNETEKNCVRTKDRNEDSYKFIWRGCQKAGYENIREWSTGGKMQKYGNADAGGIFRKSGRIWIKPGEVIYFSTDLLLRRDSERKRIRKRRTSVQVSLKIRKDAGSKKTWRFHMYWGGYYQSSGSRTENMSRKAGMDSTSIAGRWLLMSCI